MNALGVIDAVLTDDSDVFAFGARVVIRKYVSYHCRVLNPNVLCLSALPSKTSPIPHLCILHPVNLQFLAMASAFVTSSIHKEHSSFSVY